MMTKANHRIGDSWFFVKDKAVHLFFLNCPSHIEPHTAWNIDHAVSTDLRNWDLKGTVLYGGKKGEWDVNLATGSILEINEKYYMAYTGNWSGPNTRVGLAVSDDLFAWEKVDYNPVTGIDNRYYENVGSGKRKISHWRDPFLFEHEGNMYHYVCASKNIGPAHCRGTLGLAKTSNMKDWEVLPPPTIAPGIEELECPQVRKIQGGYYLIFSSHPYCFPKSKEYNRAHLRQSTYSMVGESLFGPFRLLNPVPIVPPESSVQPYAGQVVMWNGAPYLLGTDWFTRDYDFIPDPIALEATENGLKALL